MTISSTKNVSTQRTLSLSQAAVGTSSMIQSLEGTSCKQLRDMGLQESVVVKKLSCGRNLICIIGGVKLAVSKKLADQVFVKAI